MEYASIVAENSALKECSGKTQRNKEIRGGKREREREGKRGEFTHEFFRVYFIS
jgi:hypothetical protein